MGRKQPLTEKEIRLLVQEVRKRPCLWDPDDKYYGERYDVMKAWKEISVIMDKPDDVLKVKWKNLRDLFVRQLKRCETTSVDSYRGIWKYFNIMCFLKMSGTPVPDGDHGENTTKGIEEVDAEDEYSNDQESDSTNPLEIKKPVKIEVLDSQHVPHYDIDVNEFLTESEMDEPKPKKRRYEEDGDDLDVMYLKSLKQYFQMLEPMRKLVVRSKIQDLLLNEIAAQKIANRASIPK